MGALTYHTKFPVQQQQRHPPTKRSSAIVIGEPQHQQRVPRCHLLLILLFMSLSLACLIWELLFMSPLILLDLCHARQWRMVLLFILPVVYLVLSLIRVLIIWIFSSWHFFCSTIAHESHVCWSNCWYGLFVGFDKTSCCVLDLQSKRIIGTSHRHRGSTSLYELDTLHLPFAFVSPVSSASTSKSTSSLSFA
jgi:hypothetical protein